MQIYEHIPHPCTILHLTGKAPKPPKVNDGRVGINGRIGLLITTLVGTMICGYVFALIALISLPSAITSHNVTTLIAWVSSNFLQLVLLPVIIVGQNLQAKASDTRSLQTYEDAEAVLHEAAEIQKHLAAQDAVLERLLADAAAGTTTVGAMAAGTATAPGAGRTGTATGGSGTASPGTTDAGTTGSGTASPGTTGPGTADA